MGSKASIHCHQLSVLCNRMKERWRKASSQRKASLRSYGFGSQLQLMCMHVTVRDDSVITLYAACQMNTKRNSL